MTDNMTSKQKQFNMAMELYETKSIYQNFNKLISIINVSLQIFMIYIIFSYDLNISGQIFALIIGYISADFINGLVHMYMDNNENYESLAGPLIASFHLHHKTPLYKKNPILLVYFNESGSKIWLAFFEIIFVIFLILTKINSFIAYTVLYFFLLSCIAELSHYSCHVSSSKTGEFLRKIGFFLNKKHHAIHHLEDNINYAFLNGFSDPLLNIIANKYYSGYKNRTDKHYEKYNGIGTKNR